MKKIKKISVALIASFLMFYSKCYADVIDPALERNRTRHSSGSAGWIDGGEVLKYTIIGILIIVLITIITLTIIKVVKSEKRIK